MSGTGPVGGLCQFRRHQHLAREGETQRHVYRLEDGWACRYRMLADGRRQIIGLFLPGEYCEPQWVLGHEAANPVVALTGLRARTIPLDEFDQGGWSRAIRTAILRSIDRQAEWIVSLGRKSASERVCHLICDIHERIEAANRTCGNGCPMPLTQNDMADVVGLTPVHVNRVLKGLRGEGLVELKGKWLRVPDPQALREAAGAPSRPRR